MKTENHMRKQIVLLLLSTMLVILIGYIFIYPDRMVTDTVVTTSYDASSSETTFKIPLENDAEWLQTLTFSESGFLDSVKMKVTDIPESISGDIKLSILDTDRNVLYSEEIPCQRLIDGTYYQMSGFTEIALYDIGIKVKKDDILFLSCLLEKNEAEAPALTVYQRKSDIKLWISGVLQSGKMLRMSYCTVKKGQYYSVAVLLAGMIALLLQIVRKREEAFRKSAWIFELALPVFVLLLFAWINGNIEYVKSIYVVTGIVLLYVIYLFLLGLFQVKIGETLFVMICLAVTLGNYYVQEFRGQPIMVTDIFSAETAFTVAGNYVYTCSFPILAVVIIYALLYITIIYNGFPVLKLHIKKRQEIVIRSLIVLGSCGVFWGICYFSKLNLSGWDINESFEKYGWLYTNTKLIKNFTNTAPEGYAEGLARKFIEENASYTEVEEGGDKIPQNLIVIMDESFSDLSVLGEFRTNQEVLPYFNSLSNNDRIEKGWLGVQVLGSGTAVTEWEVLAEGNSAFLEIGSLYPYNLLASGLGKYNYENLCTAARKKDYYPIAMHPFNGANYNRDKVYPLMGFQKYYNIDNYYEGDEWIRWCVSDKSDFKRIIEQYENKETDKLFVFNVTMQNHGSYSYPMESYDIVAQDMESEELNSYLTLAHYTDQAIEYLLEYFSKVEEPTMIVLFGDHQPNMTDDFYEKVFGASDITEQQDETRYVTPYLIWSNYDRITYNRPYINAGYLGAIIKAEAGLELTEWDRYLLHVMDEYPVIGKNGIFDKEYNYTAYEDITEEESEELNKMKYAQYYWWTN